MAKKTKDKQKNVYAKKKPIYKRWWFIVLMVMIVASALSRLGIFPSSQPGKSVENSSTSTQSSTASSSSEVTASQEKTEENAKTDNGQAFSPQDVSDATIESIKTYEDYLTMFEKIIEDYYAQYEAAVQGTALYDQATFEELKKAQVQAFETQKKQYGPLKKAPIVGKSDLVKYLKEYRDSLKDYVKQISSSIQ